MVVLLGFAWYEQGLVGSLSFCATSQYRTLYVHFLRVFKLEFPSLLSTSIDFLLRLFRPPSSFSSPPSLLVFCLSSRQSFRTTVSCSKLAPAVRWPSLFAAGQLVTLSNNYLLSPPTLQVGLRVQVEGCMIPMMACGLQGAAISNYAELSIGTLSPKRY